MTPVTIRAARAALRKSGDRTKGFAWNPHQGEREKARRRRQMLAGQLHADIPATIEAASMVAPIKFDFF